MPQRPRPAPVKLGNIGKSFANLRKGPEKPIYEVEPELKYTGLHEQFDEDMLLLQWLSMCSRMPQQMASTAVRMKNIMQKILEFPEIEVVVDNKMLLEDIQKIQKRIRNTLVQKLRNDDIKLTLRLARQDEVKHILSSRELYDKLC